MKKILIVTLLAISLLSCVTQRRCNERFPPAQIHNRHDSIVYVDREIRKDSLVPVSDTALIEMLVKCDSTGKAYLAELLKYKVGKVAGLPTIKLKDSKLQVSCNIDSIRVYTIFKERLKAAKTADKQTEIVKVNELTKFQKFQIKIFWIYSAITVLAILLLTLKYYIKWQLPIKK